MQKKTICVVGNPNCGKTTLFNALTGARQEVGNWPGVTVEKKVGRYVFADQQIDVVDLPGIYSLTPGSTSGEDERVARDYILTNDAECVVNIVDAANLERNLYLTAQLLEMRVPMLIVVNMLDIAKNHKIEVDLKALEQALGCPVLGIVASREQGVKELKQAVKEFLAAPKVPPMSVKYPEDLADAAAKVADVLKKTGLQHPEWYAREMLEGSEAAYEKVSEETAETVRSIVGPVSKKYGGELDIAVANARYQFVGEIAGKAIRRGKLSGGTLTDRIDSVILNRWLGLPIFLAVMYVMFLFTQNFGSAFIDFFDILFGGIFVEGLGEALLAIGCPEWLKVIIADGIGGGIQTVATFVPVVFFLFLFLAVLEDSGYMARAAFVMDRLMRAIGLPGKAFVPLIIGFGCNVPAIMATRTMDRASDRIITIMMAPFMSCGARLPVYVLFATAFWPTNGQNLVFGLYIIGIIAAIVTGFLVKNIALPGEVSAFVMEIPPYHIPTLKGVMLRTWDRLKGFVVRAGQVIVVIVACLAFLNSWGVDGSFGNEDSDNSVLSAIGKTIVPTFKPMGVTEENWPAAVGVFTGILAKEAVVGTMNSLYDTMAREANKAKAEEGKGEEKKAEEEEEGFSFVNTLAKASQSVVDNLSDLAGAFLDPMGIKVDDLSDTAAAAEEQEVTVDTVKVMQTLFGSSFAAFCYLLMVLLYVPCGAAMATVYREAGAAWAVFLAAWTLAVGYSTATVTYRVGTFAENPVFSTVCILACAVIMGGMLIWMRTFVRKNRGKGPKVIPIVQVNAKA